MNDNDARKKIGRGWINARNRHPMSDPTREATCPCAGRCHHDTHPCSLGCWAAQKPWRAEEAALSTTSAPLDAAWAEAEAALPDGWNDILLMKTDRHGTPGYAATASEPRDETGAYRIVSTTAAGRKPDPTPAAALLALAEKLREYAKP